MTENAESDASRPETQGVSRPISETERAAALRAGTAPVPRKFIVWIIIGFTTLGLSGVIGEKLIGNGAASSPSALAENTGGNNGVPTGLSATTFLPSTPTPVPGPAISASMNAFLGLKSLGTSPAPAIHLNDLAGHPWSLASGRGKTLVVTFLNAECNDSCGVVASEIANANRALGTRSKNVEFVIVNSDPLETSLSPTPPLLTLTPLGTMASVTYLSGSISELATVWTEYGVSVLVQRATRTVTHNDIMYFINPSGHMPTRATPFANEGANGVFSLPTADTIRFGNGIADVILNIERRS